MRARVDRRVIKTVVGDDIEILSKNDLKNHPINPRHPDVAAPDGSYLREIGGIGVHRKALYGQPCDFNTPLSCGKTRCRNKMVPIQDPQSSPPPSLCIRVSTEQHHDRGVPYQPRGIDPIQCSSAQQHHCTRRGREIWRLSFLRFGVEICCLEGEINQTLRRDEMHGI